MTVRVLTIAAMALALTATVSCREAKKPNKPEEKKITTEEGKEVTLKFDNGVNAETKTITVGALNDESGPAAAIGKPFALGKRVLVKQINAGEGGLLPAGWKVELVEKDHGYNPQKSVQAYKQIQESVLFVGTSFGTPATLPLRKDLKRDQVMAFPASLSSKMAEHQYTPPLGASYTLEARRAMDFAVEKMGGADKIKAGIVYNQDDYGKDGLDGWEAQAKLHGVELVGKHAATPGQKDFTAAIGALKEKGANVVLLTVLPSATGPVLGTAAKMQFGPMWIGNTPTWLDLFFSPKVIPPVLFGNYYWVTGMPYWGEKVPGMDAFLAAFKAHAGEGARPDFYTLLSYIQGLFQVEAAKRAIEAGDISRAGYAKAVSTMKAFSAMGVTIDLSVTPYVTSTKTRVLKPLMDKGTWEEVAASADPKSSK